MLRAMTAAFAFACAFAGAIGEAAACKGSTVLYEDDFAALDRTWGVATEHFDMGGGKVTAKPPANQAQWRFNPAFAFEDADICLTVTSVETANAAESSAGVVFWAKDNANLYLFTLASNGFYSVTRRLAGKWAPDTIPWTKSEAIATGQGKANVLRVTTKGQSVTLHINDVQVAKFRAQPPGGPSHVGLYMTSAAAKPDVWELSALKVTNAPN